MNKPLVIALAAGEASGDKLGAELAAQLRARLPSATFYGIGGAQMEAAGVQIIAHYRPLAVMGYWDAIKGLPAILRLRRRFLRHARQRKPDIFIGIDAPDFNLRLARILRARGSKCVQYVAPSVWMWRRQRLEKIKAAVDAVLCLLPFEKPLFAAAGIAAHYVGHPAARQPLPARGEARQRLGLGGEETVIALFPGSRPRELAQYLPLQRQVIARLQGEGRRFASAATGAAAQAQMQRQLPQVVCGALPDVLAASDIAIAKSGTIALETALAGVPMLVFYRVGFLAACFVAWRRFYLPFFSLPNILSGRFVAAELLQDEASAENIARESERLLRDGGRRQAQRRQFAAIRDTLAAADTSAAAAVEEFIRQHVRRQ